MRFFERAEIKHALAYLRLVATPEDDGALLRVINFPPRGIGARTLEQLQDQARGAEHDAVAGRVHRLARRQSGRARVAAFVRLVDGMREATRGPAAVRGGRARGARRPACSRTIGRTRKARSASRTCEELVNAAASFVREADLAVDAPMRAFRASPSEVPADAVVEEAPGDATAICSRRRPPEPTVAVEPPDAMRARIAEEGATDELTAFLAHAALEAGDTQAAEGRPALQLMTVHSAKGLEFHTVFVTGLEEGLFPHENSMNAPDGVEEERRLMYVAITRARRKLYLTHAQTPHAARPDALQHRVALPGRDARASSSSGCRRRRAAARTCVDAVGVGREPRAAPAGDAAGTGWRIGQSVRHAKFGVGVIIEAEGRGDDARVQVNFRDAGVKWLALEYARLERV